MTTGGGFSFASVVMGVTAAGDALAAGGLGVRAPENNGNVPAGPKLSVAAMFNPRP